MIRRYATDADIICELKTHLALGQWEVVEAFAKFLVAENDRPYVTEIITSVALQPHLNSYCLEINVRSPEHLAFLAARFLKDPKLTKDAAFRCMLREIPLLSDDIKFMLLEAYTHGSVPEQRVLNALRQCCLLPRPPMSLYIVLRELCLPQVPLECVLQVCVQMQQTNADWPIDQLMDKLQELVSFTPDSDELPEVLLKTVSERLVEAVLPRRPERLMSIVIGCCNQPFQRCVMTAISNQQCIISRAKASGNKHFLEFHLNEIVTAMINDEKLPENLPGVNLRPLALMFAWPHLPAEKGFNRLDELERLYPKDPFVSRLATTVRECRLIASVTKMSLLDLVAQRQTQSLLRVVHSTGALRGMKDSQVIHIVNDEYQSHMLRGFLALKHASTALYNSILIAERRLDRNASFQPRENDSEPLLSSVDEILQYIDKHGPDVSFEALVVRELNSMEELLTELPTNHVKVEVLENVFSLLFVSHRELYENEENSDEESEINESSSRHEAGYNLHDVRGSGFLASENFIRTLLPILVTHIRASKLKTTGNRELSARLEKLLEHAINARWRLELVEEKLPLSVKCVESIENDDLSNSLTRSGGPPGSSPILQKRRSVRKRTKSHTAQAEPRASQASIVQLMLSTMDALLRHCLWKGDFERAQQVQKVALLGKSDVADSAELDFCLKMPELEEKVVEIQNEQKGSSAIFHAVDLFLQGRPLSSTFENSCRFYLNLAFASGLKLSVAHKLLTHSGDLSKDHGGNNIYQAIHKSSTMLATLCEKLADTNTTLEEALHVTTSHLDGARLRQEMLFWQSLQQVASRLGELFAENLDDHTATAELHQKFFEFGKMVGSGIRKFRPRLGQFQFDFTRALYAHARQVYKALEEKQHTFRPTPRSSGRGSVGSGSRGGRYFRVLEECSPSETLLRLILEDHVPPVKLEEFASKMKLNITQCVSKEVLPNIYLRTTSVSDSLSIRILNADSGSVGNGFSSSSHRNVHAGIPGAASGASVSRNAFFVAKKLLSQLIDILLEKCGSSKKGVIDRYESFREVAFSTQFDRWRESTRELSNVDLMKLKSEQQTGFFLNVLHCLSLERLIQRCRRSLPFIQSTLEEQIDESLYGYEIGCMGVVTILQLKYSILFRGHSLPPLAAPLAAEAAVEPQPFLPAQRVTTVFSLVQCRKGDPPLVVIESDDQFAESFTRVLSTCNFNDDQKKLYAPWQMEEIVKGKFFASDPERELLRNRLLKLGGVGFTLEFIRPTEFHLNLNSSAETGELCDRHRAPAVQIPPSVIRYMEQHCAPIGVILQHSTPQSASKAKTRGVVLPDKEGLSGLERILIALPNAKQTILSGSVASDVWHVLESMANEPGSLVEMLEFVDFCDAICGSRLAASKLYHLKQLLLKSLAKENYRYVLRLASPVSKAAEFIKNYANWTDKDIEAGMSAIRSVVPKDDPDYGALSMEIERIYLYQAIGRLLQVDWRTVPQDVEFIVDKLREVNRLDYIHKIFSLNLVDAGNVPLHRAVNELVARHHFSLSHEKDYIAGFRIVDRIADIEERMAFCRRLLHQLTPCRGKLYVLRYMISTYSNEKTIVERLEREALGLEALMTIPAAQRWEYFHLEEWPELIVESLLMNGYLDLVGRILEQAEFLSPDFIQKVDDLCEVFAKKALDISNLTSEQNRRSSVAPYKRRGSKAAFLMPAVPPTMKQWVRDDEINKCMICETKFSFLVRRHHCRRCGRLVCSDCSSKGRLQVSGYGDVPVRVCDDCFAQSTQHDVSEAVEAVENFTPNSLSKKLNPVQVETTWRIKEPINEENRQYNVSTRRIFCYEQAPSVSLCLSILDRHSKPDLAAEFILSLCDRLVSLLGSPSEIDHGLGIAMLQTLLLKARSNLLKTNKLESLEWCESYLETLDVLRILVKDNCQHLIPKELLQQKDASTKNWRSVHRKLRDKLLEDERFQLALEISQTCNLENYTVSAAWGMAMLKAGDWAMARDKLVYCLRRPSDMNLSKTESPLLKDILSILQNSTYLGITKAAAVYCPLANLKNIKANGVQYQGPPSTDHLVTVSTEMWFYLEKFACHSTIIAYFMRKNELDRALQYCLDHKCTNEVFIENVFVPILRSGSLEPLFDEMKMSEDYLTKYNMYLLAVCIYLKRQNYVCTLHIVQIFMEDWMRAAMTSINFFEEETTNLSMKEVTAEKLHHLTDAKNYLELFLKQSLKGDQKMAGTSDQLVKRVKDIQRHLSTVNLQIDVCRYLARREEAQNGELILLSTPKTSAPVKRRGSDQSASRPVPQPKPTLFATDPSVKHDLAAMILLNGSSVEEGFGLCLRVVADCQLDGMEVLKRTVTFLSKVDSDEDVNIDQIGRLLKCVEQSGYRTDQYDMDKVFVYVVILIQNQNPGESDKINVKVDTLMKLIKDDMNKIVAYTETGRLRSAYMLAVRLGQVDAVRKILEKAAHLQQSAVYKMCDRWLQNKR